MIFYFFSRFVEACLCCLRTLFYHPDVPVEVLYTDPALISHLLALMPLSTSNQISVASILMHSCKVHDHQTALTSQVGHRLLNIYMNRHLHFALTSLRLKLLTLIMLHTLTQLI